MLLKRNDDSSSAEVFLILLGALLPSEPQEETPGYTYTCAGADSREPSSVSLSHCAGGRYKTDWSMRLNRRRKGDEDTFGTIWLIVYSLVGMSTQGLGQPGTGWP